jgi:hypothetical protein
MDAREKTYRLNFCKSASVPRFLLDKVNKSESILDLGCGKDAYWVEVFRSKGFDIDGIDLSRPDLKPREFYDTIYFSNVVNVQSTEKDLDDLFSLVLSFSPKRVFFNYPESPRKLDITSKKLTEKVTKKFKNHTLSALTFKTSVIYYLYN